jgi:hypothetical protein
MSQPAGAPVSLSLSLSLSPPADGGPNARQVRLKDVKDLVLILQAMETITNKSLETVTEQDLAILKDHTGKFKSIFEEKMLANARMH